MVNELLANEDEPPSIFLRVCPYTNIHNSDAKRNRSETASWAQTHHVMIYDVGKTNKQSPPVNGLYHLFIVILGIILRLFTRIIQIYPVYPLVLRACEANASWSRCMPGLTPPSRAPGTHYLATRVSASPNPMTAHIHPKLHQHSNIYIRASKRISHL